MFESLVANVLNSALGKFVEGLDADALSISVFAGEVELTDLNLKDSAFDGLGVPVTLVAGTVGRIKLFADWKRLATKPIRIEIDSVLAIIKPVEKFKERSQSEFKRSLLAADEMQWKAAGAGTTDKNDGQAQSLFVQKIIDNIQISLSNVHIRYEDGISAQTSAVHDPHLHFALGLTIDRLSITSWTKEKDGTWSDRFVEEPMQMMTKRIQLGDSKGGFAVYCNSGPAPWTQGGGQPIPAKEFTVAMMKMIKSTKFTQVGPVDHVICPIQMAIVLLRDKSEGKGYGPADGRAAGDGWRLISAKQKDAPDTLVRGPFRDGKFRYEPLNDVKVDMEEISIVLASQTVTKMAKLGSWLSLVSRTQLYEAWKPSTRVGLQRGSSWADTSDWWKYAKKCNDHANKLLSVKWDAKVILSACQKRRVYVSLYSRQSAHSQSYQWAVPLSEAEQEELHSLEDEMDVSVTKTWRRIALKQMNDEARARAANEPKKRGWFSSSQTSYKELTEQELQFLQSFDVGETEKHLYPEDWIQTKISLTLKNTTLTLEREQRDLAVVDLAGINVKAEMRTDGGLTANIGLNSFIVSDRCSSGDNRTNFRYVIERDRSRRSEGQLLECTFEKKPLAQPGVDMRVQLMLQPLKIVFNPYFVEELVAFSKTGEELAREAGMKDSFEDSARARAMELKRQTERLKETALTVRTVMDLDVTLSAPTILVPADCSADETDCIMINLGDLTVKSAKGTRDHDVFEFGLHDLKVQMFTTDGVQQTGSSAAALLEPVTMGLELCNSVRPTDPSVPKLKLNGRLQPVQIAVSDASIRRLVGLATTIKRKREGALVSVHGNIPASPRQIVLPEPKPPQEQLESPKKGVMARAVTVNRSKSSKSMRSLLARAHEQHKEEEKDELAQRLPFWEQLVAKFDVDEIRLAVSDQSGSRELAVLKIQGLHAAATIRPYDKHVLMGLENFDIDDSYRAASLSTQCQLLSSSIPSVPTSTAENLLDVDFWDTSPHSPEEWRETSCVPADCVGRKLKAKFGFVSLNLHLGTVSKLIELNKVVSSNSEAHALETTAVSDAAFAETAAEVVQVEAASPARATFEATFNAGGVCVGLIPEIFRNQPAAVATMQLYTLEADVTIDESGAIGLASKLSNIEVLRGAPGRHHVDTDYILTVRRHPTSTHDDQPATALMESDSRLLDVKVLVQPESMPEKASEVKASFSGLNIQVAGPFVKSMLQWIEDNPIGKEDTAKAKKSAAKAKKEAAAKARQGAEAAKGKLMKIDVNLDTITLSVPLVEDAAGSPDGGSSTTERFSAAGSGESDMDQMELHHCLKFELGGIDLKIRNELQSVEFRKTWVKLKHGTREQELLKPIEGMVSVADKHMSAGGANQKSRAQILKIITLTGLSSFESQISFRDIITLQAIVASVSAANIKEEDPVELAKAVQKQRLSKLAGDGAQSRTDAADANDATALLAPVPLGNESEMQRLSHEETSDDEPQDSAIQIRLPDELKLVVKVLDDCTKVTKPFLEAQAALEGMKIKTEGTTADVQGSLVLQVDGFDGTRGQSVPLLERFELAFAVHQGLHSDLVDFSNAKPSLRLALGSQAFRRDPGRCVVNGLLKVQPAGKGDFVTEEVEVHGETLRIGEAVGKLTGLSWAEPKTARAGQPHAFRIDLQEADSLGYKKYILGPSTSEEKSAWIKTLCPSSTRFEVTFTDSYLRDALLTASQFKELNARARQTNLRDKTNYGDCVLSNQLGVLLYYSRMDEAFNSAHVLEPGQTASVADYLQPRVLSKEAGSRQSLERSDSKSHQQMHDSVKLWFPDNFDPANTKMIEHEACFTQSSAATFDTKTIELKLGKQNTGGANVLTLRGMVTLQNSCDTTLQAKLQAGPTSSPRETNAPPATILVLPAGGKSVGVPLSINIQSATIQLRGTQEDAEWSDSVPLANLIPYKSECSDSRSLRADHKWLRVCGIAQRIRSYNHSGDQFHSVRREEKVTITIDPAMRIRNNIQRGIDLDYRIADGGGGLGRVADFKHCHAQGCETRTGKSFFEKDYVVYKFELECVDGTRHRSEKRFSQFDDWYQTLDREHIQLFMPSLPAKTDSFFKSAEEIQRLRQADLHVFINDVIQAGSTHPPVAQALRSFMLSHLVGAKTTLQTDMGKVRFGACETVPLHNLASLNEPIDLDVAVRIEGVEYLSDKSKPTTLLSGDGTEGVCAPGITLFNREGTCLRLKIDSVLRPTGAHEFLFAVDFCIANYTGMTLVYHQLGDEKGVLGTATEPYPPQDVANWMFGAAAFGANRHLTPFCFGNLKIAKKIVICVKDGAEWQRTEPISIDAVGSKCVAEVPSTDKAKQFGVRISTAPGNAASKMVYLFPRFVVCNHTDCEIDLAQPPRKHQHAFVSMPIAQNLQRGSCAIHFPRHTENPNDRLLSIRMRRQGNLSAWTIGFGPQPAEFPLLIRDAVNKPMMIVRVTVAVHQDSTIFCHFQEQWCGAQAMRIRTSYHYIVRNLSEEWAVGVQQKGQEDKPAMVIQRYDSSNPSDNEKPFAWDCAPSASNLGLVAVRCTKTNGQDFSLTCNINELRVVRESDPRIEIIVDGSTKVLRFSDDASKPIPWHLGSRLGLDLDPRPKLTCSNPECRQKARASVADGLAVLQNSKYQVRCENCNSVMWLDDPPVAKLKESKGDAAMRLNKAGKVNVDLSFEGFGLSIVRSTAQPNVYRTPMEELLYISLSQLRVNLEKDVDKTQVQVKLQSFQIDNMMPSVAFPMVLYPEMEPGQDLLSVFLVRMENTAGLQHFKTFQMQLQPVAINVELALLVRLAEFSDAAVAQKDIFDAQEDAHSVAREQGALAFEPPAIGVGMMYFEDMVLGPLSFFVSTSIQMDSLQQIGIGAESTAVVALVVRVIGGLGLALANFKHVRVNLNGLNLNHPFEPVAALTQRVAGHYVSELMFNVYKFIFGLEIFNPVGLLDGVSTGVVNLVQTPFTVQSPEEFATGTVKNSLKLVQATVGGVFGLIGDTTGAISNVAETLGGSERSPDAEKPNGVFEGLGHGAVGVGKGLFDGVTGVFVKPVQGAMDGGALGFVEGVGKGVLGLGGNVVGGVVGGVSDVMTGIAEDISSIGATVYRPVRRTRWISANGTVPPYCASQALGQERLVEIGRKTGTQLSEDSLDLYIECDEDQELLVTDAHLVCSSLHSSKIDVVKLDEIEHIDVAEARNKLVIHRNAKGPIDVACDDAEAIAARVQAVLQFGS